MARLRGDFHRAPILLNLRAIQWGLLAEDSGMANPRKAETVTGASQEIGIGTSSSKRTTHEQNISDSAGCRQILTEEGQLSRLLRRARPLYFAPKVLRTRVSGILSGETQA
jgi:hypothetical protein